MHSHSDDLPKNHTSLLKFAKDPHKLAQTCQTNIQILEALGKELLDDERQQLLCQMASVQEWTGKGRVRTETAVAKATGHATKASWHGGKTVSMEIVKAIHSFSPHTTEETAERRRTPKHLCMKQKT